MKTVCPPIPPPGYHHNGFMATSTLGRMMPKSMICHKLYAQVHELPQGHWGDNREGKLFS